MNHHFTKNGIDLVIRTPVEEDAEGIIAYAKELFASTDQLLTTVEEFTITVEQEKKWINDSLINPDALILVVAKEREIVGLLDFSPKPKRKNAHTGELGVSISSGFRGMGIGRLLVGVFLSWAAANQHIEKVFLNVMATNEGAIDLYKKLGFREEGRHIRAIKQLNGDYVDILQMYKLTPGAIDVPSVSPNNG